MLNESGRGLEGRARLTPNALEPMAQGGLVLTFGGGDVSPLLLYWAFQGPQAHRCHVTQKSAEDKEVLTAVEYVTGSSDVT